MEALLSVALFSAEQLLLRAPGMFLKFQEIVKDKDISVEAIRARRKALAEQSFKELVPNSQLPDKVPVDIVVLKQ